MSEQDLKLAMARLLPNQIRVLLPGEEVNHLLKTTIHRFYWIAKCDDAWLEVRDFEWLYVIHLIERDLETTKRDLYIQALTSITQKSRMATVAWTITNAKWQQRATAILMTNGIKP